MSAMVTASESVAAPSADDVSAAQGALVRTLFTQLVKGCGRPNCANTHCASNIAEVERRHPNDAAVLALQLATGTRGSEAAAAALVCSDGKVRPYIDLASLRALIVELQASNDTRALVRLIGQCFGDPHSLAISFASADDVLGGRSKFDSITCGANVDELGKAYVLIHGLENEAVSNALSGASVRLLRSLKYHASMLESRAQLCPLFVLALDPQLHEPNYPDSTVGALAECLTALRPAGRDVLKSWWQTFDAAQLRRHLHTLQQYITLRLMLDTDRVPQVINNDHPIIAVASLIAIIHEINAKMTPAPLGHEDFYNEELSSLLLLKIEEEYLSWRQHASAPVFSFAKTAPFLMNPAARSKLLLIESNLEMRASVQMGSWQSELSLRVHRESVIQDSLNGLSYRSEDLKKRLRVEFIGEEGIDQGGVSKEWFQLVVREIFDPKYGMFVYNEETRLFWFNRHASRDDRLRFQLIGSLLGLAIYNSVLLDVHLPRIVYKMLMREPLVFADLADVNPSLYKGLQQLLKFEGDVQSVFERSFVVTDEWCGQELSYELKPGGVEIPLTNANREEYVELYWRHELENSVRDQAREFCSGFDKVIAGNLGLQLFITDELETLVCGAKNLDFRALEATTRYDGYTAESVAVRNFWHLMHNEFTDQQRKKLLFFATGSDRSPIGGLGNLGLVITRHGPGDGRLPTAHTCFNHLLIPEYDDLEQLRGRLLAALENAEGFGML